MGKVISTCQDVLNYYHENAPNGKAYYCLNSGVISNIPKIFYEKIDVSKYNPPNQLSRNDINLFSLIKHNLDCLHKNNQGYQFKLNDCYNNSRAVFNFLSQLNSDKEIVSPVKIVLGVYSHKIPFSQTKNEDIIYNQDIRVHDWHVWNYINEILVDTTIIKGQNELTYFPTEWVSAEEHVFIQPNTGDEYIGIAFDDYDKFEKYFKDIFNYGHS